MPSMLYSMQQKQNAKARDRIQRTYAKDDHREHEFTNDRIIVHNLYRDKVIDIGERDFYIDLIEKRQEVFRQSGRAKPAQSDAEFTAESRAIAIKIMWVVLPLLVAFIGCMVLETIVTLFG